MLPPQAKHYLVWVMLADGRALELRLTLVKWFPNSLYLVLSVREVYIYLSIIVLVLGGVTVLSCMRFLPSVSKVV